MRKGPKEFCLEINLVSGFPLHSIFSSRLSGATSGLFKVERYSGTIACNREVSNQTLVFDVQKYQCVLQQHLPFKN